MRLHQDPQTRDDSPRHSTAEVALRILATTRKAWALLLPAGAVRDETVRAGQASERPGGSLLGGLVNQGRPW